MSDNVFKDLGFEDKEANYLKTISSLKLALEEVYLLAGRSRGGEYVDARQYVTITYKALLPLWACGTVHPGRPCPNDSH